MRAIAGWALLITVALSGCNGGATEPILSGTVNKTAQGSQRLTSGGPFKASYSGRASTSCYGDIVCSFSLKGTGHGAFIGTSKLRSADSGDCQKGIGWHDDLAIESTSQPGDEIYVTVSGDPALCKHSVKLQGSFTITGGSGEFAAATGSGSVTIHLEGKTFESHFSGTLMF